ncbi:nitroreductase family protein [Bacillus sp. 165]|uniref:nitroreductase family protein n=1 Tax=Bacillus sp. 165 TaxID=1529117 RepID=UPI001ADA2DE2|nr:nitroreductase family protein [Bacillus sp. 165]MBO9129385.1 nitroreductase family protein [Bacillus sp. 165]
MTAKVAEKEEYLNKINEIGMGNVKPKELTSTDFFTVATERRSVRHYDPSFKMTEDEIRELLEIAVQAPSSSNLQPWRFLVIEDAEEKAALLPIANNQKQIVDASVVIAVLGDIQAYQNAEKIYGEFVERGMMTKEIKEFYVNSIMENYGKLSDEQATRVAMIDGGLVSMMLMLAAKAKGLDTVPMGGYNEAKFIEAFDVPANYKPVMLIAVGKGVQAGFEKVRLPLDDVLTWNKY